MTLLELRAARAKVHQVQTELNDKVQARDGVYTPEEQEVWDKADRDWNSFTEQIDRAEALRVRETELDRKVDEYVERDQRTEERVEKGSIRESEEYRAAIRDYVFTGNVVPEMRALQAELDAPGGYLVGTQLYNGIIQNVNDAVYVRSRAKIISVPTAQSLGAVGKSASAGDPSWTGEISPEAAEENTLRFNKRDLYPHRLAEFIKISKQLIRQSVINIEQFVAEEFAYRYANKLENGYLNGNGNQQPLGVFTASDAGISTSRDYSTGNAIDAIVADNLIGQTQNLKIQYRNKPTTAWMFSRGGIRRIRQLKDGDGNYLFRVGITEGAPNTILGIPYMESELCPDTWSTAKYVGILGDWQHYWIADAENFAIERLTELYALTFQVGLIGALFSDGMPVLEEAFTRVKLG